MDSRRALFVGLILDDYPRSSRLRAYFQKEFSLDSLVLKIDDRPGYFRKSFLLARSALRIKRGGIAIVVVPEFALKYTLLAWVIARRHRVPLLVDWFVGLHETRVGDWNRAHGLRAWVGLIFDHLAVRLADVLVTDTHVRAAMLVQDYRAGGPVLPLPVGAPDWAHPAPRVARGRLKILYYGTYQPLHGLDVVLDAFALSGAIDQVDLTLIGRGRLREDIAGRLSSMASPSQIRYIDQVDEARLADYIAKSDVVLGIFGHSKKASGVIANKVWQGLASGRTVVTRSSDALAEIRALVGPLLVEVRDSDALASVISEWARNPEILRARDYDHVDRQLEDYVQGHFDLLSESLRQNGLVPDAVGQ